MSVTGETNNLKKNFAFQAAYEILILILPLVTSPYIARVIGAQGLGIYSYSYAAAYYFVLFANLGILNYGNRTIAKCRHDSSSLNQTFTELMLVHILLSVVCIAAYAFFAASAVDNRAIVLIQGIYVVGNLFDISWFYFGIERFDITVFINMATKILSVISIFVFVRSADDLPVYCAIMALQSAAGQIALWIPLKKYVRFAPVCWRGMMRHMKPLLILFVPAIAISLYKYMDKIMLGTISTKSQLGFYDNSEKMITIPSTLITAFGTVMLPRMSKLVSDHESRVAQKYMDRSMRYIMLLSAGLTGGLIGVADVFSVVFWGADFAYCSTLMKGLAISIPFFAFANVLRTQYLMPQEKDRQYLISILMGAAANLSVNWILIPRMNALGAVVGTVIAEAMVCLMQMLFTMRQLPLGRYLKQSVPFLLCGAAMAYAVDRIGAGLEVSVMTLLVQLVAGAAVYLLCAAFLLWLYRDDLFVQILKKHLPLRRGE